MKNHRELSERPLQVWRRNQVVAWVMVLVYCVINSGNVWADQPELRNWVVAGINAGYIKPPDFHMIEGYYDFKLHAYMQFRGLGDFSSAVRNQLKVEGIRRGLRTPEERAFWDPYLRRVEKIIGDQLSHKDESYDDSLPATNNKIFVGFDKYNYDFMVNNLLERAIEDYARSLNKELQVARSLNIEVPVTARGPREPVALATRDGRGTILIVPKTVYLLAVRLGEPPPFTTVTPGSKAYFIGIYAYKIRYSNGVESMVKYVEFLAPGNYSLE